MTAMFRILEISVIFYLAPFLPADFFEQIIFIIACIYAHLLRFAAMTKSRPSLALELYLGYYSALTHRA